VFCQISLIIYFATLKLQEVYNELEQSRPKVETVLQQGQEYLKKSGSGAANNLQHNLRTLKNRWDSVTARASDKKIKLEIALKEATEFHEALQVCTRFKYCMKLYRFVADFSI
jgi:hypothetical protein